MTTHMDCALRQKLTEELLKVIDDDHVVSAIKTIDDVREHGLPRTKTGIRRVISAFRILQSTCQQALEFAGPLLYYGDPDEIPNPDHQPKNGC